MSDANRMYLAFKTEGSFNAALGTGNTMQKVRVVGEGFMGKPTKIISDEIRSDRQRSDLLLGAYDAAGTISAELSWGTFDALIAAAFSGAFASNVLQNGTSLISTAWEKGLLDITQFFAYTGMCVDEMTLTLVARQRIMVSFKLVGAAATLGATSVCTTLTAITTTNVMMCGVNVGSLTYGGSGFGTGIKELSITFKNNLRIRDQIDSYYTGSFGQGVLDITGKIKAYFATATIYNALIANTGAALTFNAGTVTGVANGLYAFNVPTIKILNHNGAIATKVDTDVMEEFDFRALFNTVSGYTAQLTRTVGT